MFTTLNTILGPNFSWHGNSFRVLAFSRTKWIEACVMLLQKNGSHHYKLPENSVVWSCWHFSLRSLLHLEMDRAGLYTLLYQQIADSIYSLKSYFLKPIMTFFFSYWGVEAFTQGFSIFWCFWSHSGNKCFDASFHLLRRSLQATTVVAETTVVADNRGLTIFFRYRRRSL